MPSRTLPDESPVNIDKDQIESVAIIGGGASGAIVLDSLLKERHFRSITLFERRHELGGAWCLDKETIETPNHILKPGYTHVKTDPPLSNPFHETSNSEIVLPKPTQERFVKTPSYEGIKTNIIEKMMTYSDSNHWDVPGVTDPEQKKYVDGLIVKKYIDAYIRRNENDEKVKLNFNTSVEDVERIPKPGKRIPYQFKLTLRQSLNDSEDIWYQQVFDSVVVSVGHYNVPFIPFVKGLDAVQEKFPKVVEHAKFYRNNRGYQDKKVVIVGSRASGADLSKFIADTATEVYQSIRNLVKIGKLSHKSNIFSKPVIKEYQLTDHGFKIVFEDGSVVENPDRVIYATGYQFSFPFLTRLFEQDNVELTKEGIIIPNLYQHTFLLNEPLINFVGVPIDGISFRVFEYQTILLVRYLAGKVPLPSRNEQSDWIKERFRNKGVSRAYHTIGVDDAIKYLKGLVSLGKLEDESQITGRHFPVVSEEDVEIYRKAGETLRKFWDER